MVASSNFTHVMWSSILFFCLFDSYLPIYLQPSFFKSLCLRSTIYIFLSPRNLASVYRLPVPDLFVYLTLITLSCLSLIYHYIVSPCIIQHHMAPFHSFISVRYHFVLSPWISDISGRLQTHMHTRNHTHTHTYIFMIIYDCLYTYYTEQYGTYFSV